MRHLTAAFALVICLTVAARAEDKKKEVPPPNLGLHVLIAVQAVQEELKLTDEQKKAIEEIATEARQALRGVNRLEPAERQKKQQEVRKSVEEKLAKALKENQIKRLNEIDLQQRGILAVAAKKIADALELSADQRKEIREVQQELTKQAAKLREDNRGQELQEKIGKLRLEASAKIAKILTEEQKKAWQKMVGKAFDLSKIERPNR